MNRREFIQGASSIAAGSMISLRGVGASPTGISLVLDPDDATGGAAPVQWAARELERSLVSRGLTVRRSVKLAETQRGDFCVLALGGKSGKTKSLLKELGSLALPETPEASALAPGNVDGRRILLAYGADGSGLAARRAQGAPAGDTPADLPG